MNILSKVLILIIFATSKNGILVCNLENKKNTELTFYAERKRRNNVWRMYMKECKSDEVKLKNNSNNFCS